MANGDFLPFWPTVSFERARRNPEFLGKKIEIPDEMDPSVGITGSNGFQKKGTSLLNSISGGGGNPAVVGTVASGTAATASSVQQVLLALQVACSTAVGGGMASTG